MSKFFVGFLLLIMVSSFLFVGFGFAYDSELNDYDYYKIIGYESGVGAGTDYQVVVKCYYGSGTDGTDVLNGETVAKVYVGDIQADFDDVRFSDQFGDLLVYKKCSFTLAVSAVFVVLVEADLDVDQVVRVYFGCISAVDASSDNALIDVIGGVVGAWAMDENNASLPVVDYSGFGNDGVVVGTDIVDSPFFVGKFARHFNGLGDYVDFGNSAELDFRSDNFTLVAGVKVLNSDELQVIGTNYGYYRLVMSNTNSIFTIYNGSFNSVEVSGVVGVGDILVSVGTFNGTYMKHFVNGSLVGGLVGSQPVDWSNIVSGLSGSSTFSEFINCYSLMFNRSLDDVEVSNLGVNFPDVRLLEGFVCVRKWATTTLPAVADVSEVVSNVEVSPSPSVVPISEGELSNAMLFVLGFMVVLCVVGLVWLSRVPVVVLLVGLFTVLVGLYCVLGGVYGLGVGQGWFALFTVVFGGLTMLLVGLGVRVRR